MGNTDGALGRQRLIALGRANVVRRLRSVDKDRIRSGDLDVSVLFLEPPSHWASARVIDVLLLVRGVGKAKAVSVCARAGVPENRPLRHLTPRQRGALATAVDKLSISNQGRAGSRHSRRLATRGRRAVDDSRAFVVQAQQATHQANRLVAETAGLMQHREQT